MESEKEEGPTCPKCGFGNLYLIDNWQNCWMDPDKEERVACMHTKCDYDLPRCIDN